jgi:hypothetical protein
MCAGEGENLQLERLIFKFIENNNFPNLVLIADVLQFAYVDSKLDQYDLT